MLQRKPNRSASAMRWTSSLRKQFYTWLRDGCSHEFSSGDTMVRSRSAGTVASLGIAVSLTMFLGGCGSMSLPSPTAAVAPQPGVAPAMPSSIHADELVGRWGLASYLDPKDRQRTE